jgi:phytoene dehydrogenase-like protein
MQDFDAIIIGSGAGGLTAALTMARAGKKVCVLEQHYVPGGWCHSFTLGGYRFSPGVHYIGELGPGGRMREIYEGLGLGQDLTFFELNPEGFDHILAGGKRFDIPRGKERYKEKLSAAFPHEREGISDYLELVHKMSKELNGHMQFKGIKDVLTLPFKAPTLARYGMSTLESVINKRIKDPLVRTILSYAPCGDNGLPPALSPFSLHAAVTGHYFDGGYYPKGGGATIPRAYMKGLKAHGATVRLSTPVEKILIERVGKKRRAVGVRLPGGEELRAKVVISNADPGMTYGKLIGPEHLSWRLRRRLKKTAWSTSALSLFLAVDMDLEAQGYDSGNYWFLRGTDLEGTLGKAFAKRGANVEVLPGLFMTVTTLKDRTKMHKGHHTLEMFSFVHHDEFKQWSESEYGDRPEDYKALKKELTDRMLKTANEIVPGIKDHVVFADLGTPLTNRYYVGATQGNVYGTEKSRFQIGPFSFPVRTEIDGLLMCGASTVGHGVMGATFSGLIAGAKALGCRTHETLTGGGGEVTTYSADDPSGWPEELRQRIRKPNARVAEPTESAASSIAAPAGA